MFPPLAPRIANPHLPPKLPKLPKQTLFNTPEPAKPQSLNGTTAILSLTSPYLTSPYLIHPANPSSPHITISLPKPSPSPIHSFIHPSTFIEPPAPPRKTPGILPSRSKTICPNSPLAQENLCPWTWFLVWMDVCMCVRKEGIGVVIWGDG